MYSRGAIRMKRNIVNVDGADGEGFAAIVNVCFEDESPG